MGVSEDSGNRKKTDFLQRAQGAALLFGLVALGGTLAFAPAFGLAAAAGFFVPQAAIGLGAALMTEGLGSFCGNMINGMCRSGHWRGFEGFNNRLAVFSSKMVTYTTLVTAAALFIPTAWASIPGALTQQLGIAALLADGAMAITGWGVKLVEAFGSFGRGMSAIGRMFTDGVRIKGLPAPTPSLGYEVEGYQAQGYAPEQAGQMIDAPVYEPQRFIPPSELQKAKPQKESVLGEIFAHFGKKAGLPPAGAQLAPIPVRAHRVHR